MTKKLQVYLFQPQYGVEFRQERSYWLPYSAGCIWSYVSQFDEIKDNFELADLIFRREPVDSLLSKIKEPAVCGFSCYMWNEKYCMAVAQRIKEIWPQCLIVFGGAQANGSMLKHEFIDSIVIAEGEENFHALLLRVLQHQPPLPIYNKKRLQTLDIPSPYLTGVFDKIMTEHPDVVWATTVETNRGCPYSCTFCDWGGVTYSKVKRFDLSKVQAELNWIVGKRITYIFLADANFGMFKERDLTIATMLAETGKRTKIDSVNIQYAKNSTDVIFEIAKTIGSMGRGITVSVQSMNDDTLTAIKRKNLDVNNIQRVMKLSQIHEVSTYTEVIVGLPEETLASFKQGICTLLELGQHENIDIWFCQLIENSELNSPASRQKYGIKSVKAFDYMALLNQGDDRNISEEYLLVNETNTMTTNDIAKAYAYCAMVMHIHVGGYTQYLTKYLRYVKEVAYQNFYDRLFEALCSHESTKKHWLGLINTVEHYLTYGRLDLDNESAKYGHAIHSICYHWTYLNRHIIYQLAEDISKTMCSIDNRILEFNKHFIFDIEHSYPLYISTDWDVATWQSQPHLYSIDSRCPPEVDLTSQEVLYSLRRKGVLKNKVQSVKDVDLSLANQ